MLNLMAKDIKLLFGGKSSPKQAAIRALGGFFGLVLLLMIETYVYREILSKLSVYPNAPRAFTTLFLFILSILMMLFCLFQSEKLFYDEQDKADTSTLPISPAKRIASKLILLFAIQYVVGLALEYPIFLSFGMLAHKMIFFYFLGLLYPFFAFFFEAGIAMALSYPYHLLRCFLKDRPLIQFALAALVLGLLSFAYGWVLNVFTSLLSGVGINAILTDANLSRLVSARAYLVVSCYLVDMLYYASRSAFLFYALFAALSFLLGFFALLLSSSKVSSSPQRKWKKKELSYRPHSLFYALLKKEFLLLFRDGDNLFSYSGLLLVQPYLCYAVVSSLNAVFSNGNVAYYFVSFPGLATYIDCFAILCFLSCVSGAGMNYFSREKQGVRLVKTIPVSEKEQLLAKWLPGFACSLLSYLATLIFIGASKVLRTTPLLFVAFSGLLFLLGESFLCLREEMGKKIGGAESHLLSGLYSYGLPIACLGLAVLLSFLRVPSSWIYASQFLLIALAALPESLSFLFSSSKIWMKMEVAS